MFGILGLMLDLAWKILALVGIVYAVTWIIKNSAGTIRRVGNIARDYLKVSVMKQEAKWRCRRMEAEILEKEAELSKDAEPKETHSGA